MAPRQSWEWAGSCCKSNATAMRAAPHGGVPKSRRMLPAEHFAVSRRPDGEPICRPDFMRLQSQMTRPRGLPNGRSGERKSAFLQPKRTLPACSRREGCLRRRARRRSRAPRRGAAADRRPRRGQFSRQPALLRRPSNRHWPAPSSSIPTCKSGFRPRPFRSLPGSPMPGGRGLRRCSIRYRRSLPASTGRRSWMRMPASIRRRKSDPCV